MSVRKSGVVQPGEARRGVVEIGLVPSWHSRCAVSSTRQGLGRWRDARRRSLVWRWVLLAACRAPGSAGPTRRPRVRGRCATHSDGREFRQARLHGRRLSRPALELLGPGRRERSDRRTRRVAGVSTCDTIEQHDGKSLCWKRQPFFVCCKRSAQRAPASGRREGCPPGGTRPRSGLGRAARPRSGSPKLFAESGCALPDGAR